MAASRQFDDEAVRRFVCLVDGRAFMVPCMINTHLTQGNNRVSEGSFPLPSHLTLLTLPSSDRRSILFLFSDNLFAFSLTFSLATLPPLCGTYDALTISETVRYGVQLMRGYGVGGEDIASPPVPTVSNPGTGTGVATGMGTGVHGTSLPSPTASLPTTPPSTPLFISFPADECPLRSLMRAQLVVTYRSAPQDAERAGNNRDANKVSERVGDKIIDNGTGTGAYLGDILIRHSLPLTIIPTPALSLLATSGSNTGKTTGTAITAAQACIEEKVADQELSANVDTSRIFSEMCVRLSQQHLLQRQLLQQQRHNTHKTMSSSSFISAGIMTTGFPETSFIPACDPLSYGLCGYMCVCGQMHSIHKKERQRYEDANTSSDDASGDNNVDVDQEQSLSISSPSTVSSATSSSSLSSPTAVANGTIAECSRCRRVCSPQACVFGMGQCLSHASVAHMSSNCDGVEHKITCPWEKPCSSCVFSRFRQMQVLDMVKRRLILQESKEKWGEEYRKTVVIPEFARMSSNTFPRASQESQHSRQGDTSGNSSLGIFPNSGNSGNISRGCSMTGAANIQAQAPGAAKSAMARKQALLRMAVKKQRVNH